MAREFLQRTEDCLARLPYAHGGSCGSRAALGSTSASHACRGSDWSLYVGAVVQITRPCISADRQHRRLREGDEGIVLDMDSDRDVTVLFHTLSEQPAVPEILILRVREVQQRGLLALTEAPPHDIPANELNDFAMSWAEDRRRAKSGRLELQWTAALREEFHLWSSLSAVSLVSPGSVVQVVVPLTAAGNLPMSLNTGDEGVVWGVVGGDVSILFHSLVETQTQPVTLLVRKSDLGKLEVVEAAWANSHPDELAGLILSRARDRRAARCYKPGYSKDPAWAAITLALGLWRMEMGREGEATEPLEHALASDALEKKAKMKAHGSLGCAYQSYGDYEAAIDEHHKCLAQALLISERAAAATCYGNMATCHHAVGDCHAALELYRKKLLLAIELGDKTMEACVHGSLCSAYQAVGEERKAEKHHERQQQLEQEGYCGTLEKQNHDRAVEGNTKPCIGLPYQKHGAFLEFLQPRSLPRGIPASELHFPRQ